MHITGQFGCDLKIKSIDKFGDAGVRIASLSLKTQVAEDLAAERFGQDFYHIAFRSMRTVDGIARHACAKITKPNLVVEQHDVELCGHRIRVMPEIPVIETIKDEPAVVVCIILPVVLEENSAEMIGSISVHCGDMVRLTWAPIQVPLPLSSREPDPPAVAKALLDTKLALV